MIPAIRKAYNESFTKEKYRDFLKDLNSKHPEAIEFRVAETPIFVSSEFANKMLDACESIVDFIKAPNFKTLTERSIPQHERMANENEHSHMIAFDFGVCTNEQGELEPQLIEMQGFPTLYCFQSYYPEVLSRHFIIPGNFSHYFNGYDKKSYLKDLKEVIA